MAKRSQNLMAGRPDMRYRLGYVWAIEHSPRGRGQMEFMHKDSLEQSYASAVAKIDAGESVWLGRDLWDVVYAWWEQKQSRPDTHMSERPRVCVISANVNQQRKDSTR